VKNIAALVLLFASLTASFSFAEDVMPAEVARFLDSRKLVSIIYFQEGSSALSNSAKQSIETVIPRLSLLDMKKVVVRIEGFAPLEGREEVRVSLSMNRALAVMNYLQKKHHMNSGLFLIGCGDRDLSEAAEDKRRRVEVALYDNLWDLENAPTGDLILNW